MFEVQSAAASYSVVSERNVIATHADAMRKGVVIVDEYFAPDLAAHGIPSIALHADEAAKSFDSLGAVIVRVRQSGATRNSHIWAIGGGAIQDVAGFVASIYMRGLSWTYAPTTLLGMVDSCIGGKSSINVGAYKNIVGTFHTPAAVLIDVALTDRLSIEQRVAGLVEAAKICYCRGAEVFAEYLRIEPHVGSSRANLEAVIELSLTAKKWFVEVDEFDHAERLLLNLGHTFGHALEGASGYRLSHGVAVGVGILCALALSGEIFAGRPAGSAALLRGHMLGLLNSFPELRERLRGVDPAEALERLQADKKHEPDQYRFITFNPSGAVALTRLPKTDDTRTKVIRALRGTLERLSA